MPVSRTSSTARRWTSSATTSSVTAPPRPVNRTAFSSRASATRRIRAASARTQTGVADRAMSRLSPIRSASLRRASTAWRPTWRRSTICGSSAIRPRESREISRTSSTSRVSRSTCRSISSYSSPASRGSPGPRRSRCRLLRSGERGLRNWWAIRLSSSSLRREDSPSRRTCSSRSSSRDRVSVRSRRTWEKPTNSPAGPRTGAIVSSAQNRVPSLRTRHPCWHDRPSAVAPGGSGSGGHPSAPAGDGRGASRSAVRSSPTPGSR